MSTSIVIKNLSKKYTIASNYAGRFRKTVKSDLASALRNPLGFINHTSQTETFWALENITYDVQKGDIVGIIGLNGSGKSTLLRILAKITPPSKGEIHMRGTPTSLLGIGIGFHGELSGRENIFLNGAILGFSKKQMEKEFDAIVAFSGIEQFIDTQVKYYSSGMYVRLAFSIATVLPQEPDILLIDEVLAVGDLQFQEKCIKRIKELVEKTKTTVLFVSHNMQTIEEICNKCLWIDKGKITVSGSPREVIKQYKLSLLSGETKQSLHPSD